MSLIISSSISIDTVTDSPGTTSYTRWTTQRPLRTNPPGAGPPNGGPETASGLASAALYLYTFLATLLLLLAISSAIVIRSILIRRRRRRILQQAIQTGIWPPGDIANLARLGFNTTGAPAGPGRTRDIGDKPKMWEVCLHAGEKETAPSRGEETKGGKPISSVWRRERVRYWDDILPLHVAFLEEGNKEGNKNELDATRNRSTQEEEPARRRTMWVRRQRSRRTDPAPAPAAAAAAAPPPAPPPVSSLSTLVRRITSTSNLLQERPAGENGSDSSRGASSSNAMALNATDGISAPGDISLATLPKKGTSLLGLGGSKFPIPITVATLIAMPQPSPFASVASLDSSTAADASNSRSPTTLDTMSSSTTSAPISNLDPTTSGAGQTEGKGRGERPFPYLELGMVEVVIMPPSDLVDEGRAADKDVNEEKTIP